MDFLIIKNVNATIPNPTYWIILGCNTTAPLSTTWTSWEWLQRFGQLSVPVQMIPGKLLNVWSKFNKTWQLWNCAGVSRSHCFRLQCPASFDFIHFRTFMYSFHSACYSLCSKTCCWMIEFQRFVCNKFSVVTTAFQRPMVRAASFKHVWLWCERVLHDLEVLNQSKTAPRTFEKHEARQNG